MSSAKTNIPKPIKVEPSIIDPRMKNTKLSEEPTADDDITGIIFDNTPDKKTQEELKTADTPQSENVNTILIIVFAMVVIALIAIIVWMVLKNTSDKKSEEDIKQQIRPHPKNQMPQMDPAYEQRKALMQQQYDLRRNMTNLTNELQQPIDHYQNQMQQLNHTQSMQQPNNTQPMQQDNYQNQMQQLNHTQPMQQSVDQSATKKKVTFDTPENPSQNTEQSVEEELLVKLKNNETTDENEEEEVTQSSEVFA